jgi:hypothetical protein
MNSFNSFSAILRKQNDINGIDGILDINNTFLKFPYTVPISTTNYGNNFATVNLPASNKYTTGASVGMSYSGQYIVTIMIGSSILVSNNYGSTFITTVIANTITSVVVSSSGKYIYIYTSSAVVYYSSNYGVSFTSFVGSATQIVISFNEKYVFRILAGILYYSTDYGTTFNTTTKFGSTAVNRAGLSYTGGIQSVNNANNLYVSTNFGSTWVTYSFTGISNHIISNDGKYILGNGNNGTNYYYFVGNWDGTNHTFITTSTTVNNPRRLAMSFSGRYMIFTYFNINDIAYSNDYGTTWSTMLSGVSITDYYLHSMVMSLNGKVSYITFTSRNAQLSSIVYVSNNYGVSYGLCLTTPVGTDGLIYMSISANGNIFFASMSKINMIPYLSTS